MEHNIKIFSKRTVLYFATVVLTGAECKNRLTDRLIADIDGDNAGTTQNQPTTAETAETNTKDTKEKTRKEIEQKEQQEPTTPAATEHYSGLIY